MRRGPVAARAAPLPPQPACQAAQPSRPSGRQAMPQGSRVAATASFNSGGLDERTFGDHVGSGVSWSTHRLPPSGATGASPAAGDDEEQGDGRDAPGRAAAPTRSTFPRPKPEKLTGDHCPRSRLCRARPDDVRVRHGRRAEGDAAGRRANAVRARHPIRRRGAARRAGPRGRNPGRVEYRPGRVAWLVLGAGCGTDHLCRRRGGILPIPVRQRLDRCRGARRRRGVHGPIAITADCSDHTLRGCIGCVGDLELEREHLYGAPGLRRREPSEGQFRSLFAAVVRKTTSYGVAPSCDAPGSRRPRRAPCSRIRRRKSAASVHAGAAAIRASPESRPGSSRSSVTSRATAIPRASRTWATAFM